MVVSDGVEAANLDQQSTRTEYIDKELKENDT